MLKDELDKETHLQR